MISLWLTLAALLLGGVGYIALVLYVVARTDAALVEDRAALAESDRGSR